MTFFNYSESATRSIASKDRGPRKGWRLEGKGRGLMNGLDTETVYQQEDCPSTKDTRKATEELLGNVTYVIHEGKGKET